MEQEPWLIAALSSNDSTEIDAALATAANCGMAGSAEMQALKARSEKLQIQYPLVVAMENAIKGEDVLRLQDSLDIVKKLGLISSPDEWLKGLDGEHLASSVRSKLCENRIELQKELRVDSIRLASARLSAEAVKWEAQDTFEADTETSTPKACEPEQMEQLEVLKAASQTYDFAEIDELLLHCEEIGVQKEDLVEYHKLLSDLQSEDWLQEKLLSVEEDVKSNECQDMSMEQLHSLASQLQHITGDELYVADAEELVQRATKKRAPTIVGAEVSVANECFDPNVSPKHKKNFRGHAGLGLMRRMGGESGRGDMKRMVSHTTDELKEALTEVPPKLESQARQTFRDILSWMNDKPGPESRRMAFSLDVVTAAKSSAEMTDEVYCQVLKQLTDNPSPVSTLHGWKLLLRLCQEAVPSTELQEFVRAFLARNIRALRSEKGELLVIARQCLSDFDCYVKEAGSGATSIATGMKFVVVSLMDQSTRKVRVEEKGTLIEVGEALAVHIRLQRIQDFRFFHVVEADAGHPEVHRMLPVQTPLNSILAKMAQLEKMTQRRSRLLLKRVFMGQTEVLRDGNMMHATLTYRQALYDFIHYPIWEAEKLVQETSATMLLAERGSFTEALNKRDLSCNGDLERAMPEQLLGFDKDRRQWSTKILKRLDELEGERDPQESRLQTMSRVFAKCQQMRLFGSMYWFAQQITTVPPEFECLSGLPKQQMTINKKDAQAEYWICATCTGISFVPVDCGPGEDFIRKFQFNPQAHDHVVRWGFKGEYFQIVVSACDPDNPASGVVEWVISCHSPSAPDVCCGIQSSKGNKK